MKFTLNSTALTTRLMALSRVINSKNSLPILGDFLFEVGDGQLLLTASDSENTMRTSLELNEVDMGGRFCISSKDMIEAMKGIADQPITFDVDQNELKARIIYNNGYFSLPINSADEYPAAQEVSEPCTVITISNMVLADNINRSIFATAQDELRPVMNGIYFDLTPENLTIVASDGHKLVRNRLLNIQSQEPAAFIMPKKPATLLKGMLGKDGSNVQIRFDERNAEINHADGVIICRLIEGRFPNYNSVIPQNNPNLLTVDRQGLLSALKRVLPFANEASNLIRFHVESGELQLDAEDYDLAKTASEKLLCEYSGIPMSIGFNGASFIEVLSNFDCKDVNVQLADPSRAGLVLPSEMPQNQDILMLLMPVILND